MPISLRLSPAILVTMALCALGCGGDKASPTPQELSDALLTVTDMDVGWSETQRQVFYERSPENPSIDPSVWCPGAADITAPLVALAGEAGADVELQFESDSGVTHMVRLQAWSNADVGEYLEVVRAAAEVCDGYSGADANGVRSMFDVIGDRSVGDESVSWVNVVIPPPNAHGDKLEYRGRTTVARFDEVVMVLQYGDVGFVGETQPTAEDAWWAIVRFAAEKLSAAR